MSPSSPLRLFVLAAGLSLGALAPSLLACIEPNPDHCVHNGGDDYCAGKDGGERPYCSDGTCVDAPADGCVAEPPTGCWSCNGVDGDNANCDGQATGDGDGDMTGDGDGDTGGDGDGDTTTGDGDGEPECTDSSQCANPTPLCEGGVCVNCVEAQNTSCLDDYPDAPVCDEGNGLCVICSAENDGACEGTTPVCVANECVGCTEHGQCSDSACNLSNGACLDVERVWWVDQGVAVSGDGSVDNPYKTIAEALGNVGNGEEGTIRVITEGTHDEAVLIPGGRTVALLGEAGGTTISADQASCLTMNSGSSVFIQRVRLTNGNDGVTCNAGGLWFDDGRISGNEGAGVGRGANLSACAVSFRRSAIVNNSGGGIVFANGGSLTLENSTVGGNVPSFVPLDLGAGSVSIAYSTIAASFNAPALVCQDGGASVTIRNSLLLNEDAGMPVLSNCDNASISTSALESDLGSNTALGQMSTTWFADWATGDLRLSNSAPAELADAATWVVGDPATDIDGDARPSEDGTADYAGADIP